jgi:hypothetical protein
MLTRAIGAGLLFGCLLHAPAMAEGDGDPLVQVRVAMPAEAGRWRTRSQPVFDAHRQELQRRTYTVFDPRPSRGLDFVWIPDRAPAKERERVTGEGRIVWRLAGRPSYDPAAFVAEYAGTVVDGRPHGQGTWRERDGTVYEGRWVAGVPSGEGRLVLASGAEFAGTFRDGAAEGAGHFFDVDGEVFEGSFRRGLREGQGRTVLPNGAAYLSEWTGGEEVAASRKIRLAQLGPAPGPANDIRLGVSVDRKDDESALQYAASNQQDGLLIQPSKKRLVAMWKGNDDITLTSSEENPGARGSYGVFAYTAGDLPPLSLVFEVQNRAAGPVRIRGAYLDVDSSASDLQPAIQLTAGSSGECGARDRSDFSPTFQFENFGWSPAEKAQMRFAFVRPKSIAPPGAPGLTKDLGLIRASTKVDLEGDLRAAGVKTADLKRRGEVGGGGIACRSKGNAPACLAEIAGSGLFGTLSRQITLEERDIYLNAAGTLNYTWRDQKGQEMQRSSPFATKILLGRTPIEAECGEGAEKEPVGRKPLEFRLDQSRYRLPVAFERTIAPGRSARYVVGVAAAKSSEHKFKVVLQTADGQQIISRPISLTYFRPSRLVEGNATE